MKKWLLQGGVLLLLVMLAGFGIWHVAAHAASRQTLQTLQKMTIKIGKKTVTKKTYQLEKGKSAKLAVSFTPRTAKVTLQYKSSDKRVVQVSKNGKITAKKEGTAKIQVTATTNGKKKEKKSTYVTIQVTVPAKEALYPQHEPYGTGVGAVPGRVVWAYDPDSVEWNGSGYWWETDHFDEKIILNMLNESIASLGGKETAEEGWEALFAAHNEARKADSGNGVSGSGDSAGKSSTDDAPAGYQKGEKIAIKANINGSGVFDDDTSGKTDLSYTNPVLLKALLRSLVEEAGVRPADITVYDVSRLFPDYMVQMCTEGTLKGVRFVGRNNGVADETAPIQWSYSFRGNVNYMPTCVTEAAYIINLANLKGHSYGITLCGKNHFGSFINGNAMRPPEGANLHQFLAGGTMNEYSPLTDLMAQHQLGEKTVLYLLDAIICAPSEGASITKENATWEQAPFLGDYTSSIFISQDPVAIDSVGADFLANELAVISRNGVLRGNPNVENYLHEAGLVGNAPSGTVYYNGNGERVENLGVHEHWNNSEEKQYSRNLGKEEGIELILLHQEEDFKKTDR